MKNYLSDEMRDECFHILTEKQIRLAVVMINNWGIIDRYFFSFIDGASFDLKADEKLSGKIAEKIGSEEHYRKIIDCLIVPYYEQYNMLSERNVECIQLQMKSAKLVWDTHTKNIFCSQEHNKKIERKN